MHGAPCGAAHSLLDADRHLRDVLRKKGHAIEGSKIPIRRDGNQGAAADRCSCSLLLIPGSV
jgi:hypothetical protein